MPLFPYKAQGNPTTIPNTGGTDVKFSPGGDKIAVSISGSPSICLYPWNNRDGFGQRFNTPSTNLAASANTVGWHSSGSFIVVGIATTPFIAAYPVSSLGFGAKYVNPASLGNQTNGVAWSPNGDWILVAGNAASDLITYAWNNTTGFGTRARIFDATIGAGTYNNCDWHPSGSYIAGASTNSPYLMAFRWTTLPLGSGAKFADPTTLPTGSALDIKWSQNGNYIAVGHATTPFLSVYPWTSLGPGEKLPNPSTPSLPNGQCNDLAWFGNYIFAGTNGTPYLSIYEIANGTLVKVTRNDFNVGDNATGIDVTSDGKAMAITSASTPFVIAYSKFMIRNFGIGLG